MTRLGRLFPATLGAVLALDLWTKALIEARFQLFESLPLLPGLALTYVRNKGAAFSLLAGAPEAVRRPFFFSIIVAAAFAIAHYLRQTPLSDRLSRLGLGLVAGGALGNAVDRARYGEVVDFVQVSLGFWPFDPWPIFNVADSAVCVGVTLLLWRAYKPFPEEKESQA